MNIRQIFQRRPVRRLAAIDIGTNSFHLVVVEWDAEGKVRVLDRAKEYVRLGSGGKDMKIISQDAIDRGLRVLHTFADIAHVNEAPVRAVATSAVREALNQKEFIRRAKNEAGIHIEVVSGLEEARLIYLGILNAVPVYNKKILMIDIGGGSVEYLIGYRGEPLYAASLKLGTIRLTQRFFKNPVIRKEDLQACRKHIRGFISHVETETKRLQFDLAVGSSGTIQNVAGMITGMQKTEYVSVKNTFTAKELRQITARILKAKNHEQRLKIAGIDPKRADILTAGSLVLQESFDVLKIKEMAVSDYALREGIVFDYIRNRLPALDPKRKLEQLRHQSVVRLAKQFKFDTGHSEQTVSLALQLYDQLIPLHQLTDREREMLEYAAILHEVGLFISHDQHHRHSYYLIRNAELPGFTDTEKEIIANIARYHRKSHPKSRHEGFSNLTPEDQMTVRKLSGILRVADALDRSHRKRIKKITCEIKPKKVIVRFRAGGDTNLEIWAVDMKKQLFEEVFRRKIIVE